MATVRKTIDSYDDGLCQFWYEYNDVNLRVTAFGCDNNGPADAWGQVARQSDGLSHEVTILAGTSRQVTVPTNTAAVRFVLTVLPNGKLAGIDIVTNYQG